MATTPSELQALRGLLATSETPELGPGPRAQVQSLPDLNRNFDRLFRQTSLPAARQELLRCVVLLWHDHHEAAHEICQQIETPDGSWLHGLLGSQGEHTLVAQLLPRGEWDSFAFVAACEQAAGHSGSAAQRDCLRQIQAVEFEVLVDYFWNDRPTPA